MYVCACGKEVKAMYALDEGWVCFDCLIRADAEYAHKMKKAERELPSYHHGARSRAVKSRQLYGL